MRWARWLRRLKTWKNSPGRSPPPPTSGPACRKSVQGQAEKTTVAAKAIADRMTNEVIEFSDFMKKMNDSEKATLKLEVEKLRRGEVEWLQVLVHILDHVFALHTAAVRSGDAKFTEPITNFQNACRDTARRVGLAPFVAEPAEPFNAERHQVAGWQGQPPPAGAVVAETIGAGYTFQGKLLRPALVRLRDANAPAQSSAENPRRRQRTTAEKPAAPAAAAAPAAPAPEGRGAFTRIAGLNFLRPPRRQKVQPARGDRPRINFFQRPGVKLQLRRVGLDLVRQSIRGGFRRS